MHAHFRRPIRRRTSRSGAKAITFEIVDHDSLGGGIWLGRVDQPCSQEKKGNGQKHAQSGFHFQAESQNVPRESIELSLTGFPPKEGSST
jgi:hypothetical protein